MKMAMAKAQHFANPAGSRIIWNKFSTSKPQTELLRIAFKT